MEQHADGSAVVVVLLGVSHDAIGRRQHAERVRELLTSVRAESVVELQHISSGVNAEQAPVPWPHV